MKEAIEIVGALTVLAVAWICIAEVFPPECDDDELQKEWEKSHGKD